MIIYMLKKSIYAVNRPRPLVWPWGHYTLGHYTLGHYTWWLVMYHFCYNVSGFLMVRMHWTQNIRCNMGNTLECLNAWMFECLNAWNRHECIPNTRKMLEMLVYKELEYKEIASITLRSHPKSSEQNRACSQCPSSNCNPYILASCFQLSSPLLCSRL